ncbi:MULTISPECIES: hypothetical protein [Streptomyces]|uniref:DUF222 domain-containing protein n=2 Tax=Streptomyces TaxID=1883 RepID=A0ABU4KDJ7_9ACTN|nr:hypothetical protein [Streptomyces roseolus]MDX2295867.1 hypothetical protein [Streptomyces roseolus]
MQGADAVVAAYETALGRQLAAGSAARLRKQAVELLGAGRPVDWLCERAAEMPALGYQDLIRHADHPRHRLPGQTGSDRARPERDASMCWKPGHGSGAYPADDCSQCLAESRPRREGPAKINPADLVAQLRAGRAAVEARG